MQGMPDGWHCSNWGKYPWITGGWKGEGWMREGWEGMNIPQYLSCALLCSLFPVPLIISYLSTGWFPLSFVRFDFSRCEREHDDCSRNETKWMHIGWMKGRWHPHYSHHDDLDLSRQALVITPPRLNALGLLTDVRHIFIQPVINCGKMSMDWKETLCNVNSACTEEKQSLWCNDLFIEHEYQQLLLHRFHHFRRSNNPHKKKIISKESGNFSIYLCAAAAGSFDLMTSATQLMPSLMPSFVTAEQP